MYAIELLIPYNSIYQYFQMTYRKNNTQTYLNMDSDEINNIGFYFKYILNQSVIYYHIFIITSLFILHFVLFLTNNFRK